MVNNIKSLLPKKALNRDALTLKLLNIKPRLILKSASWRIAGLRRLIKIFSKLSLVGFTSLILMGYYPVFSFPPLAQRLVLADDSQKLEVVSAALSQTFQLPHPGYVSSRFSSYHPGLDLAAGLGMPIHPITEGEVSSIIYSFFDYGNHVTLTHKDGFKSLYGHMGRVYVKKGQKVYPENIIGEVGLTGRTSGPHTHLEITRDDQYIDPLTILPKIPAYPTQVTKYPTGGPSKPELKLDLRKTLKPDF